MSQTITVDGEFASAVAEADVGSSFPPMLRFALFGIPVEVQPTFWLVALMLSRAVTPRGVDVGAGATWIGLVFVSILVHELGHAWAMRRYGREPSIALVGFGGETRWGDGPRVSPGRVAVVSLAGPFAGFAFAIPFALLYASGTVPSGSWAERFVRDALFVNVGWGVLNLLPILPLDGGRVADVIGFSLFGSRGARGVRVVSLLLAGSVLVYAIAKSEMWIGMLAGLSIVSVWSQLGAADLDPSVPAKKTLRVDDETARVVDEVWDALFHGSSESARAIATKRLGELTGHEDERLARAALLEALAWVAIDQGDDEAALALRAEFPEGLGPSALLEARLLIARGDTLAGLEALDAAYLENPGDHAAIVTAAAWLDVNRPDRVVDMLRGIRGAGVGASGHAVIASALFHDGRLDDALAVSDLAWNRFRSAEASIEGARALARLGRADEALTRLSRARNAGASLAACADDPDFASLAHREDFAKLVARDGTR